MIFWSCEVDQTAVIDQIPTSSYLSSVSLNRAGIDLDNDTLGGIVRPLGSDRYEISVEVAAKAVVRGGGGPVALTASAYKPGATDPFSTISIDPANPGADSLRFLATLRFVLQRSDIGMVRIAFAITQNRTKTSNSSIKSLRITRRNSAPRVIGISVPDTVTLGGLPSPDSTFLVTAAVADSDGIADIGSVSFESIKPDNTCANNCNPIPLFDDGSTAIVFPPSGRSGDQVPGDGIFSVRVRLVSFSPNPNPPPDTLYTLKGYYTFTFSANDNAGAFSDTVVRRILVK